MYLVNKISQKDMKPLNVGCLRREVAAASSASGAGAPSTGSTPWQVAGERWQTSFQKRQEQERLAHYRAEMRANAAERERREADARALRRQEEAAIHERYVAEAERRHAEVMAAMAAEEAARAAQSTQSTRLARSTTPGAQPILLTADTMISKEVADVFINTFNTLAEAYGIAVRLPEASKYSRYSYFERDVRPPPGADTIVQQIYERSLDVLRTKLKNKGYFIIGKGIDKEYRDYRDTRDTSEYGYFGGYNKRASSRRRLLRKSSSLGRRKASKRRQRKTSRRRHKK
jgi:hypothetical protein